MTNVRDFEHHHDDAAMDTAAIREQAPDPKRWKALALLCAAFFMVCLDGQIVMLALPLIERDLDFSPAGVQ